MEMNYEDKNKPSGEEVGFITYKELIDMVGCVFKEQNVYVQRADANSDVFTFSVRMDERFCTIIILLRKTIDGRRRGSVILQIDELFMMDENIKHFGKAIKRILKAIDVLRKYFKNNIVIDIDDTAPAQLDCQYGIVSWQEESANGK